MNNLYLTEIQTSLENSDFWQKIAIAIISALTSGFLVALFNYLFSNKQRQGQAMELSYTTNILSILEFKKDIDQKNIRILYGENYELADVHLISCNIENTGRKVIKDIEITFELFSTNIGILEQFFEPPLNDNLMGLEETEIEEIKQGEVKKRYLIREILPKHQVGFRFLSGRRTLEDEVPKLFCSIQKDNSKVELIPRTDKGDIDEISTEISRIMNSLMRLAKVILDIINQSVPSFLEVLLKQISGSR